MGKLREEAWGRRTLEEPSGGSSPATIRRSRSCDCLLPPPSRRYTYVECGLGLDNDLTGESAGASHRGCLLEGVGLGDVS